MKMKRIINLQWTQLKRNRLFYFGFLSFALVAVFLSRLVFNPQIQDCSGGVAAVCLPTLMSYIVVLFVMENTAVLINQDYADGTMYLMLTAGYSRTAIYFIKMLFVMCINSVMGVVLMLIPVVFHTMIYGWGDSIDLGGYAIRLLLLAVFLYRVSALMILLSFILKNRLLTIGCGIALIVAECRLTANYQIRNVSVPILSAFNKIFDYTFQIKSHFISGYVTFDIKDCMNVAQQVNSCFVSLAIVLLCALVGCGYFQWNDI